MSESEIEIILRAKNTISPYCKTVDIEESIMRDIYQHKDPAAIALTFIYFVDYMRRNHPEITELFTV